MPLHRTFFGSKCVDYEIKRSARAKWARLEIQLHRGVRVVLPERAPESDAEKLLRSKSSWLLRNLARYERLQKIVPNRRFVTGERLPYLDETLTLSVAARVERRGETLFVPARHPRAALEEWYVSQAEVEFPRRVTEVATRFGIAIKRVRVSRARTRWGTCSRTGSISLNWRLMLAPSVIVDYLVAHELSHVGHRNHSTAFWSRVAELHPAYAESERWLRRNGRGLVL